MFACGVSSRKDNDDVQPEEKKEETGQKKVGYKESPVDWLKSSSAVNDIMVGFKEYDHDRSTKFLLFSFP